MRHRCFICHRPPRGFGWHPTRHHSKALQNTERRRFCSKLCQDIHHHLLHKGVAMNRTDLEQQAVDSVLEPLADYVVRVGLDKGLGHYSKAEIQALVDTILEAYHTSLRALYKDEVPF